MYVTRPKGWDDLYWSESLTRMDVIEDEPQPTGLLDASGRPIYRVRDPIRLGFKDR